MNPRSGMLIGLLITALAGFGFYTLALKPKRQEAARLATEIDQQQQQLDAARALLAASEKARQDYRRSYATVVRLGKAVPAEDDVRSLVIQLESAAKAAKVDFASIDVASGAESGAPVAAAPAGQVPPGASAGPAGFPMMQFTFTFRGRFFRLGDYLERLHGFVDASNERLRVTGRLLTLDSVKLAPDGTSFERITASVSATSYLTSPLEGLTAGATAEGPAPAAATPGAAPPTPAAPAAPGTSAPAPTTATSTGGIR